MIFESKLDIMNRSWQAFERDLSRLLTYEGFDNVRLVGQSSDHGADVTGNKKGKKWLFQAKRWRKPVGMDVIEYTKKAAIEYEADVPVVVAANGFDNEVKEYQKTMLMMGIPLQLWDADTLVNKAHKLPDEHVNFKKPREYQKSAIDEIVNAYINNEKYALIVMATGLGKTFVAAEAIRRIKSLSKVRVLVCSHTNELVYQLERAFWPFLKPSESTMIWNNYEHPVSAEQLENTDYTFACVDSVSAWVKGGRHLPEYEVLFVDECHHVGACMYDDVFDDLCVGQEGGTFALGVTATPWRSDEIDLSSYFGNSRISIDMIYGLKHGFLANVDYRMYTDNINWDSLKSINGRNFSPRQINRTLFINQWDDAVVNELQNTWRETFNPRAIVFCSTIEHAKIMRNKINQLGFCRAEALFSARGSASEERLSQYNRNRLLSDFADGKINAICAVDIFNEGIDVPDVNIIVFQRVTHSRRIFIQQLGRGLRIADDKEKVIVLDFVSDIRRFAAGISLKDQLQTGDRTAVRINIPNKVTFMRMGVDDPETESFLRQWLDDVVAIEDADEDASVLKYPPLLDGEKK